MSVSFINKVLDNGKTIFYAWFESMHTRIDIVICNQSEDFSKNTIDLIYNELHRIEQLVNRFDPSSELYRLNQTAAIHPVTVSPELFHIIADCIDYYEKTSGCFDVTVNSLESYRNGIKGIVCDLRNYSISYKNPAIKIDLGGFAKGYALDKSIKILKNNQMTDALVNFGNSSVFAIGNHPSGCGWKITLPTSTREQPESVVLHDECLTTSGNEEAHLHILSPFDGQYIKAGKPVSVVTKDATSGEVFSTALFVSRGIGNE
ncbi:MAG: FAD:protein FMN transferase [Dysgonamonadaceae bacterium]|jgi:thiamine biosynthesis lipoprotein|nr:FAD:protein FMN transferase [Dysgonamonadaceae bacterium]